MVNQKHIAYKLLLLVLAFYTMYSVKVDIAIYTGQTGISIEPNNFQFDRSICNPKNIKALMMTVKSQYKSTAPKGKTGDIILQDVTPPKVISQHTRNELTTHTTPVSRNISEKLINSSNHAGLIGIPSQTLTPTLTQTIDTKIKVGGATNGNVKKPPLQRIPTGHVALKPSKHHMPGLNQDLHRDMREKVDHVARQKDILLHQTNVSDVDKDGIDMPDKNGKMPPSVGQRRFNETLTPPTKSPAVTSMVPHVVESQTLRTSPNQKIDNITITAPPVESRKKQKTYPIGNPKVKSSSTRVIHAVTIDKSSPFYVESVHPLHIDLAKYVREKLESDTPFPVDAINLRRVEYTHTPIDCSFDSSKDNFTLLVLVRSDARHFDLRSVIRDTWGSVSLYPNVRLVFVIGFESMTQQDVAQEAKQNGDILQGNFKEIYVNSTQKTIMAFTWATVECPDAGILLLAEEDHLLQVNHILKYIRTFNELGKKKMFAGFVINFAVVERKRNSHWSILRQEYPLQYWPPYLRGGALLVSRDIARQMNVAFPYVKYVHVHDAYLGIVAKKLNLDLTNDVRFYQTKDNLLLTPDYFAYAGIKTPKMLNDAWYSLTQNNK